MMSYDVLVKLADARVYEVRVRARSAARAARCGMLLARRAGHTLMAGWIPLVLQASVFGKAWR